MPSTEFSQPPRRRTLLIIMDGMGLNPSPLDYGVAEAATPNLDKIWSSYPTTVIEASGRAVGLPAGQMGNSEVGHLSLGCGSVLRQDLVRINDATEDGSFASNPAIQAMLDAARAGTGSVQLVGLVSDGGIHSHLDHLLSTIDTCGAAGVAPLLHVITDGRDTAPVCATRFLERVEPALAAAGGAVVSVSGRYFAMDRDQRWDRVEKAWLAMVRGQGQQAESAVAALAAAAARDENDEFIQPTVLPAWQRCSVDDGWFFFNFRNDRPRELAEALGSVSFAGFERGEFSAVALTTMTRYDSDYDFAVAFEKEVPQVTLGELVSQAGIAQLRAAETEKYPHVTFFFSGGQETPFTGEDRLLVNSPKVATYDLEPAMSAAGIRDGVLEALAAQQHGLLVVNFANGDMVGHTGVREAVISAVETVDSCVGELVQAAIANDTSVVLTADHGNADMLLDPNTGVAHTQHTTFPVACTIIDSHIWRLDCGCGLTAVAPTILQLMGLAQPEQMTGPSLLLEDLGASRNQS